MLTPMHRQSFNVDEQPGDLVGEGKKEYAQADFDFEYLAQRADGPVPDPETVAFLGGEVLAGLPWDPGG